MWRVRRHQCPVQDVLAADRRRSSLSSQNKPTNAKCLVCMIYSVWYMIIHWIELSYLWRYVSTLHRSWNVHIIGENVLPVRTCFCASHSMVIFTQNNWWAVSTFCHSSWNNARVLTRILQWFSPRDRGLGLETVLWWSWSQSRHCRPWSWSRRIGLEYFSRQFMHLAICQTFVFDHLLDQ